MWPRLRPLWFCFSLVALIISSQPRDAIANQAVGLTTGSSTPSPSAFQSPAANAQPSANSAAAIGDRASPSVSDSPTTTSSSETTQLVQTKPLALVGQNDRSASRLAPPNAKGGSVSTNSTTESVVTVLGSLGIVLGLFFVSMWLFRGNASKAGQNLPAEVVEPLGRTIVAKGQRLQLIRFGRKLVLVSLSSAGIEPISEITDPVEVDRIAGLCHGKGPLSSTQAFQTMLDGFSGRGPSDRYGNENRRPRGWGNDGARAHAKSREDDDV
jgi:flagellar protein FliO/FliZ